MTWSEYYKHYDDWEDKEQYSRLASITDFGPKTSPASEIAECSQNVDDKTARRMIKLALKAGVRFSSEDAIDILECDFLEGNAISDLVNSTDESTYTAALLERLLCALCDETPALQLIDRICRKPNHFVDTELVSLVDALCDEERSGKLLLASTTKFSEKALEALCDTWVDEDVIREVARRSGYHYSAVCEEDNMEDYVDIAYTKQKEKNGIGLLGLLIAGVAAAGNSGSHKKHNGRCNGDCANCPPHYGYRYGRWYYGHGHMYGCQFGGNRRGGGD